MEAYEHFELLINDRIVKTPVAIASMAGIVDAAYVLERADHVGVAFIGGYSIDQPTLDASRAMAEEGRTEFVYDDPVEELVRQVELMKQSTVVPGINLRGSAPAAYLQIAEALKDSVIYEIDAHCRQKPMIDAGCGEYLLKHTGALVETIRALKSAGVTVSVKIRAGVSADDRRLARMIWEAGADLLHVDLMDFGYQKLRQIRNASPIMLIANNSITTFDRAMDMFSHGADLISVARKSDPWTLSGLDAAITRYAAESGWYNAPKQLCRGGDIRALAFCCMPVKDCPLMPTLKKIGMSRDEYIKLKVSIVENTPLAGGEGTCFGSLAWCCKSSSPCLFRNMTLQKIGLTLHDYMRYKHRMADKIMNRVFHADPDDDAS